MMGKRWAFANKSSGTQLWENVTTTTTLLSKTSLSFVVLFFLLRLFHSFIPFNNLVVVSFSPRFCPSILYPAQHFDCLRSCILLLPFYSIHFVFSVRVWWCFSLSISLVFYFHLTFLPSFCSFSEGFLSVLLFAAALCQPPVSRAILIIIMTVINMQIYTLCCSPRWCGAQSLPFLLPGCRVMR